MSGKQHKISNIETLAEKFKSFDKQKVSIEDFYNEFLTSFISKNTQRAYIRDLNYFFEFLKKGDFTPSHPAQIKSHHFSLYRDCLIEKGLSSSTINRRLTCIRSFIKWCQAKKLLDHNPLDAVKLPKVQTQNPTNALSDQEAIAMIEKPDTSTIQGRTHRLILVLLFNLGLRRSELTNIKIKDFSMARNHLILNIKGKGEKSRQIPISENVKNEIEIYINQHLSENSRQFNDDDFLLPSPKFKLNDRPIDGSTIYRIVNRYAKSLGIHKQIGAHSCRATVISHLLDTTQTPIRDVALFAGHSNINTTQRYDKKRKGLDNSAAYDVNFFDKVNK